MDISNGSPYAQIDLFVAARIVSFNSYKINLLTEEKIKSYTKYCKKTFRKSNL